MNTQHKALTWTGWGLTVLLALMLTFSAVMKLRNTPEFAEQFSGHLGYPAEVAFAIGVVELTCLIVFLVPQTSVLGAILLTGYLGGAVATHVRLSEAFIAPVIAGILVWGALFLRDPRVRGLIPIRRGQKAGTDE